MKLNTITSVVIERNIVCLHQIFGLRFSKKADAAGAQTKRSWPSMADEVIASKQ
jgi:hypothetical protein